jgi:hypothetical protein
MEHMAFRGRISVRTPPQSIVWNPHNFGLDEPQGPLGKQTLGPHKTVLCTLETAVLASYSLEPGLAWPQRRFVGTDEEGVTGSLNYLTTQYRLLSFIL